MVMEWLVPIGVLERLLSELLYKILIRVFNECVVKVKVKALIRWVDKSVQNHRQLISALVLTID